MKKILLIILLAVFFASCKSDYEITKAEAYIKLPEELPSVSYSAKRVNVYSAEMVSREQYDAIDDELTKIIETTNGNIPQFVPKDVAKSWTRFKKHSDFHVLLIPSTYTAQDAPYTGCPLLTMYSGITVIGTVAGVSNKSGRIEAERPFIVVPYIGLNPAANCFQLWRDGINNEAEHVVLINDSRLFRHYQGYNDIHDLFTGEELGLISQPKRKEPLFCGFQK